MNDLDAEQDKPAGARKANVTKASLVAEFLRYEITTGLRPIGSSLPSETQLMERFGMSRPTHREVLRILESDGLVRVARGVRGGGRVVKPTTSNLARSVAISLQLEGTTVQDVFAGRLNYEPAVIKSIVDQNDTVALGAMAQYAAAQEFCTADPMKFNDMESAFRRVIIAHSSNAMFSLVGGVIDELLHRHMTHLTRRTGASPELVAHRKASAAAKNHLVRLMKDGKADAAERRWREYLLMQRDRVAELTGGPRALMEYYARDDAPVDPATVT